MTRIVFLGTPEAAVPTLQKLDQSWDVGLVVTQPDRPKGRSARPVASPVKKAAVALGVPLSQPKTSSELEAAIVSEEFDLGVVVAYGRILKPKVLAATRNGYLNVHFSLLPRWRGAAPVARAIMAGDQMTGVTIIRLDEGLDTGPVLTAQAVDIGAQETAGALTTRLADLGASLISSALPAYLSTALTPLPQSDEGATYADKVTKSDRPLDTDATVVEAVNQVRGLAPVPGATLNIDGEQFKILAARPSAAKPESGTWITVEGAPVAGFGGGGLELTLVQPPAKTPQSGADWLRGARRSHGSVS